MFPLRIILFVDSFGQQTRSPLMFEKLPVEHRLVGSILATSFCDRIQFVNLADSSPKLLPSSSPHLVFGDEERHPLHLPGQQQPDGRQSGRPRDELIHILFT